MMLVAQDARDIMCDPVHPNIALEQKIQKRLLDLVDAMNRSIMRWVIAAYRSEEGDIVPDIAEDISPAERIRRVLRKLRVRWEDKFDLVGDALGEYFAEQVEKRSRTAFEAKLRKAGFTVRFQKPSKRVIDITRAMVAENVTLIRNLATDNFVQVEGAVMRSVMAGGDLETLTKTLQERHAITRKRAILIATHQNRAATAEMNRARALDQGITKARWIHSSGGKEPRRTHVKAGADRVVFDLAKGWYDPDEGKHVIPGQLIRCRCIARFIVPGLERGL